MYQIDFQLKKLSTKPIIRRIESYNDWFAKMAEDISKKVKEDDFDPSTIDFTAYGNPSSGDDKSDKSKILEGSLELVKGQPDFVSTDGESGAESEDEAFPATGTMVSGSSQPNGSGSIASTATTATYETARSKMPESGSESIRGITRKQQPVVRMESASSSSTVDQTIKNPIVMPSAGKKTPLNNGRSARHASRTGGKTAPGSDSKTLTDSAVKRRREAERLRIEALERQMREKEEKALKHKQLLMEQKQSELKQKREEKERRNAELKEQLEREAAEKRLRESAKKREIEKRRREIEEAKKEGLRKRQEMLKKQEEEGEVRRQAEENERIERVKKEEEAKKRAMEAERVRQEQVAKEIRLKVQEMKQQKNNSLIHKATANSFLAKNQAIGSSLVSEDDSHCPSDTTSDVTVNSHVGGNGTSATVVTSTTGTSTVGGSVQGTSGKVDTTFTMPKGKVVQSYDISDLTSDNESDDERHPRHIIPDWAKGQNFLDSLGRQFRRPAGKRAKDQAYIFREVQLPVELGQVFSNHTRAVISKYEKRTSSAHWNTPPASKLNLSSFLDASINRSRFETSIAEQPE